MDNLDGQAKDYTRTRYALSWRSMVRDYAIKEGAYLLRILDFLDPRPGQTILECGIGTDEPLGLRVVAKGALLFGVDIAVAARLQVELRACWVTCVLHRG
jgi:hypothetical protein